MFNTIAKSSIVHWKKSMLFLLLSVAMANTKYRRSRNFQQQIVSQCILKFVFQFYFLHLIHSFCLCFDLMLFFVFESCCCWALTTFSMIETKVYWHCTRDRVTIEQQQTEMIEDKGKRNTFFSCTLIIW